MTIHEPATLATDYLLAAIAAWLARELHRKTSATHVAARWWRIALALTAASAFVGGSYHGFAPNLPPSFAKPWWLLTLWLVSLISATMATAWVYEVVRPAARNLFLALVAAKLLVFAALAARTPDFKIVILDYGSALLLWLGAALILRRPWSTWMIVAIALSIVAALVQQLHFAPASWFNHNDLYHLIQAFGLAAFYRAALRLTPALTAS